MSGHEEMPGQNMVQASLYWVSNSVVRVWACQAQSRGFNARLTRQFFFMSFILFEFFFVFFFALVASVIAVVVLFLSLLLADRIAYTEKLTAYECGFDPFEDARSQFNVRFYLVALLFLLFDLEASFLIPWSVSLGSLGSLGFWVIFDFFFELAIGFYYAWRLGAFLWDLWLRSMVGLCARLQT